MCDFRAKLAFYVAGGRYRAWRIGLQARGLRLAVKEIVGERVRVVVLMSSELLQDGGHHVRRLVVCPDVEFFCHSLEVSPTQGLQRRLIPHLPGHLFGVLAEGVTPLRHANVISINYVENPCHRQWVKYVGNFIVIPPRTAEMSKTV